MSAPTSDIVPLPVVRSQASRPAESAVQPGAYFRVKMAFDRLLALALLVPALPLIGALVWLVRRGSPGPGIYRQRRVGLHGRVFTLYKIRSMRVDAEAASGAVWSGEDDPRITPLGRFLRRTHLDELPQLFNVLRGQMALIGPRPERPEFTRDLARQIPEYMDRYAVPPGITGLAQINLPPDKTTDDVRRKLVLDFEYIAQAGPLFDLRIFLSTCGTLFGFTRQQTRRALGLERTVLLPTDRLEPRESDKSAPRLRIFSDDEAPQGQAARRREAA